MIYGDEPQAGGRGLERHPELPLEKALTSVMLGKWRTEDTKI